MFWPRSCERFKENENEKSGDCDGVGSGSGLRGSCAGHNFLYFYSDAIETCLQMEEWDEVDRYAQALENYTSAEPLPYTDFFITRGRALAAFGRGDHDDAIMQELQRLRDEAERVGLKVAIPALEEALSST